MNNKFSIGVVIAIVLQVSGFVWWIAQQSQTIDTLKDEVAELTAKSEIEKEVILQNEVRQLRIDFDKMNGDILSKLTNIDNMRSAEDTRLVKHVNDRLEVITNNMTEDAITYESWFAEIDEAIDELDKKLSDRVKDHTHQ